ncbi:MAG TPA: hypothetical protein VFZ42_04695 [Chitinophagaceae bacterium]
MNNTFRRVLRGSSCTLWCLLLLYKVHDEALSTPRYTKLPIAADSCGAGE